MQIIRTLPVSPPFLYIFLTGRSRERLRGETREFFLSFCPSPKNMSTLFYDKMAKEDLHGKNGKPKSVLIKQNNGQHRHWQIHIGCNLEL